MTVKMTKREQRAAEIQGMVCEAVAAVIERDMRGDEQLMKQVWQSYSSGECKIAADEIKAIVELIQRRANHIQAMAAKTGDCPYVVHASDCNCRGEAGDR